MAKNKNQVTEEVASENETPAKPKVQKYATFNADGAPTAFYSTEIHGENIPSYAVEISDDDYVEFINNQGKRAMQDGKVVDYTPPAPILTIEQVKSKRDSILKETDWTQLPDVVEHGRLTAEQAAAWKAYRQAVFEAVKDVDPNDVAWPEAPKS